MSRKQFEQSEYSKGIKAEAEVLESLLKHRPFDGDAESLVIEKNSDKYGIDIVIKQPCDDGTYQTVSNVEVMVRQSINYSEIFIEFNKLRFLDLPQDFIIVIKAANSSTALVLTEEKCRNLASYKVVETSYNTNKTPEKNILVPRSEFVRYDLTTGKITS